MSLPADLAAITKSDHILTDPHVAASYVTDWTRPASRKPGRTCSDDNESAGGHISEETEILGQL